MKVRFNCDSGSNIKKDRFIMSCRYEVLDTVKDLNLEEEEWEHMTEDERYKIIKFWASKQLNVWYEELSYES